RNGREDFTSGPNTPPPNSADAPRSTLDTGPTNEPELRDWTSCPDPPSAIRGLRGRARYRPALPAHREPGRPEGAASRRCDGGERGELSPAGAPRRPCR